MAPAASVTSLPADTVNPAFGKVSYRHLEGQIEVTFTMPPASAGQGWRTGIAMDASTSMQHTYGKMLIANIPDPLLKRYRKKDWARDQKRDGKPYTVIARRGWEDAFANGLARWSENELEPLVRPIMQYFANDVDTLGGTTVVYFGCGKKGGELEDVGIINGEQCESFEVGGPEETPFGKDSQLLPALRYFDENFEAAPQGVFVFITDGRARDLGSVKSYSTGLAKRIASGKRNPMKCFLIGIGDDLDEQPLVELANLATRTSVELWDYESAETFAQARDVIRGVVDETAIAFEAPTKLLDDQGNEIRSWPSGVPSKVTFQISNAATFFELEIEGQERIRQELVGVAAPAGMPPEMADSAELPPTDALTEGLEGTEGLDAGEDLGGTEGLDAADDLEEQTEGYKAGKDPAALDAGPRQGRKYAIVCRRNTGTDVSMIQIPHFREHLDSLEEAIQLVQTHMDMGSLRELPGALGKGEEIYSDGSGGRHRIVKAWENDASERIHICEVGTAPDGPVWYAVPPD